MMALHAKKVRQKLADMMVSLKAVIMSGRGPVLDLDIYEAVQKLETTMRAQGRVRAAIEGPES
jgi:hypothetical protein